MAITDAYNATGQAAQIAQNMFSPATNVLSSALNNAVDAGRRMVDLQSHQEDIFLSEREKLRLATERKGLEARRIYENDRNFGEDVLRDRRNFDESVFQDRRDFGLESAYKMGSLGIQQAGLGLEQQRFDLQKLESASRIKENEAHSTYYLNGGSRADTKYKPAWTLFRNAHSRAGAIPDKPTDLTGKTFSLKQEQDASRKYNDVLSGYGVITGNIDKDMLLSSVPPDATPEELAAVTRLVPLLQDSPTSMELRQRQLDLQQQRMQQSRTSLKIPNILDKDPSKGGIGY